MALTFDAVSVALSGRPVLHDIDLALEPAGITVVLGANGAGKSTLLRTALALVRPKSGRVLLDGEDVADMPSQARARLLGYLPQSAEVHWNMRVDDVVALGRLPHFAPAWLDARVIQDALLATNTASLAERSVASLSGGERARVLLARVLAGQPRWLLADEPLASLDPAHQIEVLALFRTIAAGGTGILLVLHDLTLAARIADRIIVLREGRIIVTGPTSTVLTPAVLQESYGVRFAFYAGENGPIIVAETASS